MIDSSSPDTRTPNSENRTTLQSVKGQEKSSEDLVTARLCITGMVQGVGYRSFTRRVAALHDITGSVRNLPDGRVQVLAKGTQECLERLICELKKGPFMARVEEIQVEWNPSDPFPAQDQFAVI